MDTHISEVLLLLMNTYFVTKSGSLRLPKISILLRKILSVAGFSANYVSLWNGNYCLLNCTWLAVWR